MSISVYDISRFTNGASRMHMRIAYLATLVRQRPGTVRIYQHAQGMLQWVPERVFRFLAMSNKGGGQWL